METTPLEALQFLDNVLSKVGGSRQDHTNITGAIGIIAKALNDYQVCAQAVQAAQDGPLSKTVTEPVEPSFPAAEELAPVSPESVE